MSKTKFYKWLACAGLTLFGAPSAWASCSLKYPDNTVSTSPAQFSAPGFTLTVDATKNVGDTLGTATVTANAPGNQTISTVCTGYITSSIFASPLPLVTVAGQQYYDTGIPGIGLRISNSQYGVLPTTYYYPAGVAYNQPMYAAGYTFTFYKIGDITQAGTLTGVVATRSFTDSAGAKFLSIQIGMDQPIVIIPKLPTCSVTTQDVKVTLDPASTAGFHGAGSVVGSEGFNIVLSCSGGDPGVNTGVYMTMTDATNAGNRSDILSLTAASSASGVGIRVFQQGSSTPISYGADSSVIGNVNQFKVNSAGNQTLVMPFTASYVQAGSTVTSGTVEAVATFTMAYN